MPFYRCTSLYIDRWQVCISNLLLLRTTAIRGGTEMTFANRGIDARSVQKTPAGTVNNIRPCTLFTYTFAMQTCYCIEPPPSVAVLIRRGLFAVAAWTPLVLTSSEFRLYAKLTVKTIQGCIVLAMRQRRCLHIFKRSFRNGCYRLFQLGMI